MTAEVINKINITAEAVFDYEECLDLGKINKRPLKAEVEEYINNMNKSGKLLYDSYFRCKYFDEDSDKMLMLFFYRAERLSIMQFWNLAGICLAKDWTEDAEDNGEIRNWLKCKITDMPEEQDWVIAYRVNIIIKETRKTKYEEVLKEVLNDFDNKRDKEAAKEVALLQSYYFEFSGKPRAKRKARNHRKSG